MNKEENKNDVLGVYEELKGVLTAIADKTSWFDDDGFSEHANFVIERVRSVCPEIENIDSYKIKAVHSPGRSDLILESIPTKTKLNSLIGRLKGTYGLDFLPKNDGNIFVQNQSQNQSQSLTLILELQEKIISEIPKHTEGTKERSFLEKLKSHLPTIKTSMDILASALKIGAEVGLDPATIHRLLGL